MASMSVAVFWRRRPAWRRPCRCRCRRWPRRCACCHGPGRSAGSPAALRRLDADRDAPVQARDAIDPARPQADGGWSDVRQRLLGLGELMPASWRRMASWSRSGTASALTVVCTTIASPSSAASPMSTSMVSDASSVFGGTALHRPGRPPRLRLGIRAPHEGPIHRHGAGQLEGERFLADVTDQVVGHRDVRHGRLQRWVHALRVRGSADRPAAPPGRA